MTYPHDDDKCRQDSVDADGFRSLSQQVARMVTPNMGPVVVPDELSPDDGTRHYSVRSHEVPVKVVPDLPGLGDAPYNHEWRDRMSEMSNPFGPSDEEIRAYLEGEHGPPHPEVVAIIQDDLLRAVLDGDQ